MRPPASTSEPLPAPAGAAEPRPTTAGRLAEYVRTMFPPAIMVPYGIACFLAVHLALQALAGFAPLRLTARAAAGAASVVLTMLLFRIYDELKDVENDVQLARAGDPRYRDRPIVTGRVRVEDLGRLRWITSAALVALNAPLGTLPLAAFAAVYAVGWLSFKWFFWPAIARNLLLAFATHNPITLVVSGYVVAVYAADFGAASLGPWTVALVCGLWLAVAAWETSRKIRIPEDETAYQTYSMLLGWKTAALVPAGFLAASAGLLVAVARAAGLGWTYPAILGTAAAAGIGACLLFRLAPTRARARLQPYPEAYGLVANAGLALAVALARGVTLG